MSCYVYIVRLQNGRMETGAAEDLYTTIRRYQAGAPARRRRVQPFLYMELHPDRRRAQRRVRQLKRWPAARRLALAQGDHAAWR
jgi:predicted GIY-YIG superfamily endonuclease